MKRLLFLILILGQLIAFSQPRSRSSLVAQANVIKNEVNVKANTATRIGQMYVDIINNTLTTIYGTTATGTNDYSASVSPAITSYIDGSAFLVRFTNTNTGASTLKLGALGTVALVNSSGGALEAGDIEPNTVKWVVYYQDTGFIVVDGVAPDVSGGSTETFTTNPTLVLASGFTFGKYSNGSTPNWIGLTPKQAILDALISYINPVFTSFSITGQSTTAEVGITLSGSKTFTWGTTANSGVVSTIDVYNNSTSSTLLAGTPNDGSQAITITTVQLNSNGATQSWRGIGNNSSPTGTFNSSNFVVTSRYYRFYGPASASPSNSATVRALSTAVFHTGASAFNLSTGTTLTKFVVALPPSVTISSVIDLDALNADITSEYVLTGTINVLDAGSSNRVYNIYEMNVGVPYSATHRHQITTNN